MHEMDDSIQFVKLFANYELRLKSEGRFSSVNLASEKISANSEKLISNILKRFSVLDPYNMKVSMQKSID